MKLLILTLFLACLGCSKMSADIPLNGYDAALISLKMTDMWVLVRIDTLWKDKNIAPQEFKKILAAKQIDTIGKADCPPLCYVFLNGENVPVQYEILKYIY